MTVRSIACVWLLACHSQPVAPRVVDMPDEAKSHPVEAPPPPDAALPDAAHVVSSAPAWDVDSEWLGSPAMRMRPGIGGERVRKELGKPDSIAKHDEAATWTYPGITFELYRANADTWTVRAVSVAAPSTFTTSRRIHVGSTRADVIAAYRGTDQPDRYVVGEASTGLVFTFDRDGKVATISLGGRD